MKDDYLWDGTGEPDPEVERIEKLLGRYRHQAKKPGPLLEQQVKSTGRPLSRASREWTGLKYAAAAALLIALGVFALLTVTRDLPEAKVLSGARLPDLVPVPEQWMIEMNPPNNPLPATSEKTPVASPRSGKPQSLLAEKNRPPQPARGNLGPSVPDAVTSVSDVAFAAAPMNPFVDPETARHIERAQALLRSFRNTEGNAEFDLSYERRSSRSLLSQNILLRRNAEAKRNLPVQELLGTLEPFLIDIANLPDKPSADDVSAIKAQIEKKDIITGLQVYSAPMLSRAF